MYACLRVCASACVHAQVQRAMRRKAVKAIAVQCSALRSAVQCFTQRSAVQCSVVQYCAAQHSAVQPSAEQLCRVVQRYSALHFIAVQRSARAKGCKMEDHLRRVSKMGGLKSISMMRRVPSP